jgi:hypothetical protein
MFSQSCIGQVVHHSLCLSLSVRQPTLLNHWEEEERFSASRMGRYIHTYLLLQTTCCLLNLVFLKRSRLLVTGKKVGPFFWPNHPAISSNHAMPAAWLALIRFQRCSSSREDLLPIELTIFGFKIRNWRWDCLNCIALIYGASLLVVNYSLRWRDAIMEMAGCCA